MEDPAVTRFRKYLQIKTNQPDPDYQSAVVFLKNIAEELGLPCKVVEVHPGKPCVVISWEGTDPKLPTVVLNSHMDVGPVGNEKNWKYPPLDAVKTENGDIYARGSQDMKCVGMQYTEAVRKLKMEGETFKRTVHILFVPEEDVGSKLGMELFIKHPAFEELNLGVGLDEGMANSTDAFSVYYAERSRWWVVVNCRGNPGHTSRFIEGTAIEKAQKVMASFQNFRCLEEKRLKDDKSLSLGDVITATLTLLKGGSYKHMNAIPSEIEVGFDIRIPPNRDMKEIEQEIARWCTDAGDNVTYRFESKCTNQNVTSTSDDDLWWKAFSGACNDLQIKIEKGVFPAFADARLLRQAGFAAYGFSPINNTEILLHNANEYLNEKVYLKGIDIYCKIIPALANA